MTCEECGDEIDPGCRRIRCRSCKVLVCGWCYHHGHGLGYRRAMRAESTGEDRASDRTERNR